MREICLDTETTGLDPRDGHRIIEIACFELVNKVKTGKFFHSYVNPRRDVPEEAFRVHGIATEFLKDKPLFNHVVDKFLDFIKDDQLVIHNASFDLKFINYELSLVGKKNLSNKIVDSLLIARNKFPGAPNSLDALCKRFAMDLSKRSKHGAFIDTDLLCDVYIELMGGAQGGFNFDNKNTLGKKDQKISDNYSDNNYQKSTKNFIESRKYQVCEQDLKLHQEFILKNFKSNLWGYN